MRMFYGGKLHAWPPGLFRDKKQQQSQVQLNCNVFNDKDNRERAKMSGGKKKETKFCEYVCLLYRSCKIIYVNVNKFCGKKNMETGGKKMRNASSWLGKKEHQ